MRQSESIWERNRPNVPILAMKCIACGGSMYLSQGLNHWI